jgi:hypothetical protein
MVVPHLVGINTIHATGQYFYTKAPQFSMFFSNC